MSVRGKRVAVARMKNGVLHIVAPLRESVPVPLKQFQNSHRKRKDQELIKRKSWVNQQENQEESNQSKGEKRHDEKNEN